MAKSRRKKNYKLRKRVMRTVAALTMVMAIVVAAIPVENYGTMRAADARTVFDSDAAETELDGATAHYTAVKNTYEKNAYDTEAKVQRITESGNSGSFVEVFKVKKESGGSNAMIVEDIIGDGKHGSETQLTINYNEYCDYIQFDAAFIGKVEDGLKETNGDNKEFKLTFGDASSPTINVPDVPGASGAGLSAITVKTISTENPTGSNVGVSIGTNDTDNKNAQGYTSFSNVNLSPKTMYEQDFGKKIYDDKISAINTYNTDAQALITRINAIITRTTAENYSWQGSDTTAWNDCASEANTLNNRYDIAHILSTPWTDFVDADNGLNGIVDYIIRNYCKNGTKDLKSFRLKGLTKQNDNGDTEGVYVPQYKGEGNYTGQLDEKNYLATSKVNINGIASYDYTYNETTQTGSGNKVFYGTHLNTIVLPQGIDFIGKDAFAHSDLTSVTINATTCKIIGEEAFAECTRLAAINFSFGGSDGSNSFMTIDKKAFYNTVITQVKIPSSVETLGAGAFASATSLATVEFEDTGRGKDIEIEEYAFYNCTGLTKVSFPENNTKQYKIGRGAFALANPGGTLNSFTFPGGNTDIDCESHTPSDPTPNNCKYDYILANRSTLQEVTFPGGLKSKIPDNTLAGCNNLSWVKFPENAKNASYNPDKLFIDVWRNPDFYVIGPEILQDPGSRSKPRVTTWEAKAGYLENGTWALISVPYMFTDSNGKEHFEIGVSDDDGNLQYIANIEVIDKGKKEAALVSYFPYNSSATFNHEWINIKTTVGEYKIVSIEKGCFDDAKKLKDNVTKLTIGDSVVDIKAGAFKEMPKLQWVDIGSGVKNIESEAFAGCDKLENVVFSQALTSTWNEDNVEYWQELKIAGDAFKTQSEYLTFHGAINPNYAPFKMAMAADNYTLLLKDSNKKDGVQICYKTDAPLNLTVIRNRADGKATLVNYPHYEDMVEDAINAFEKVYITGEEVNETEQKVLGLEEDAILQTLKMELPSGIESIDAKSFFAAESQNNLDHPYINLYYEQQEKTKDNDGNDTDEDSQVKSNYERKTGISTNVKANNGTEIESIKNRFQDFYSKDADKDSSAADTNYATTIGDTAYMNNTPNDMKDNYIVSTGGLFSGGFRESELPSTTRSTDSVIWQKPYENHTYVENHPSGNDYLTEIHMPTVKELPKYAFDSCENLLTVGFNAMESMEDLPFRGCKSLYDIDTGNSKYKFQNLMLYETKTDGSYELVECLEGRGTDPKNGHYYYTGSVTSKGEGNVDSMLSNVTSIKEGAFSNCNEITEVDLGESKITKVPQRAFENCTDLYQVMLPETVMGIDQKAFKGAADKNLHLTIKNPNCTIAVDAFDFNTTKEVFIHGISTDASGKESVSHYNYEQIKAELEKSGLKGDRIHFSEADSTCLLTFVDDQLKVIDTEEVDKGATLKNPPQAPAKTGYKFNQWMCTNVRDENGNPLVGEATYSNVTEDRTIMATYDEDPLSVVPDGKEYNLIVENGRAMINGTMVSTFPTKVKSGTSVAIMANDDTNFKVWTITHGKLSLMNPSSPATSFTMPTADVTVTANSALGGSNDPNNPNNPSNTYTVTVNNGTGSGQFAAGATVTITANTPNAGASFVNWTTATTGVTFASATSSSTTFVMPASNVSVTANFSDGTGGQPGGSTTGKHKVTVNYGSGSGEYAAGETVNISAYAPEVSTRVFSRWTTNNSGLGFANANAATTSFVMPAADVVVTANYKVRTNDDDDDDDSSTSRRPGTNSSTTTVDNRPGSSSTTSTTGTVNDASGGTGSTTSNNNGNRIYITKNGISNTDVASLAVSGSTDNFIVRITESPEATAAVEQALTNTYGSLNGLAYLPMDISLYDSTGQNKITDTTGLNITVTMPIPDVLIQYGGNARVAAADNGVLQQITPRFTTIDGIACISFIPPHFSPYVIYVDTNNLIAGQMLDSTPATGDPIHPKWFAAIGMACVSILLFVTSDGRKRKKYRAA